MRLEEFWKGRVVFWCGLACHVTGFGQNAQREVLIKIKPEDQHRPGHLENVITAEVYIHPSNLSFEQSQ